MLNYAVPVSLISLGLQQTGPDTLPDLLLTPIKYRYLQVISKWAMLDLNPRRRLERAVSWASRRWGLAALYRLMKKGLYSQFPTHSHSISRLFGESYSKAL